MYIFSEITLILLVKLASRQVVLEEVLAFSFRLNLIYDLRSN